MSGRFANRIAKGSAGTAPGTERRAATLMANVSA